MAIVTGPLFSLTGRQSVGKTLVFYRWRGLNLTRQWVKPKNPQTPAQVARRALFTAAAALWRSPGTAADKQAWALFSDQTPGRFTAYSAYMQATLAVAGLAPADQAIALEMAVTLTTSGPYVLGVVGQLYDLAGTTKSTIKPIALYGKTPSTTEGQFELTNTSGALSANATLDDGDPRYVRLVLPSADSTQITGLLVSVAP
jgi:hypothetical protein